MEQTYIYWIRKEIFIAKIYYADTLLGNKQKRLYEEKKYALQKRIFIYANFDRLWSIKFEYSILNHEKKCSSAKMQQRLINCICGSRNLRKNVALHW